MSILDRLNLLIRSEITDMSRGSSFRNAMSEMDGSLKDARRQQAELRRSEAALTKQIRDVREKADRWEERAVLALKNGDEDLAREALIMKNRSLDEATRLRDQLDDYRSQIRDIERALEALDMKLQSARGRMESRTTSGATRDESAWDAEMKRRMKRDGDRGVDGSTKSRGSSGGYLDPLDGMTEDFGTSHAFAEFDRMSSKINAIEADIDAMRELDFEDPLVDPKRRKLEEIFDKMEKRKKSDDDLADLKAKFE